MGLSLAARAGALVRTIGAALDLDLPPPGGNTGRSFEYRPRLPRCARLKKYKIFIPT